MENRLKYSDYRPTNSFYGTKSGFITTFTQGTQQQDIRKSRIEHLPSYKKVNFAGKLDFVVVFQTIQIERLSLEIESLRVTLKDADRQIHNYLNYEVQIKELTQNCHQLQQQRVNYQNQIQQMSLACNSLYQQLNQCKKQYEYEIEDLKKQFLKNKNQLTKENELLKDTIRQLQNELKKKIQNQKDQKNKIKTISQELVRLNQNLYQSQNQITQLRDKDAKKNQELNKLKHQIKAWENTVKQEKNQGEQKNVIFEKQKKQKDMVIKNLESERQKLGNQLQKKKSESQNIKNNWQKDMKLFEKCKNQLNGVLNQNEQIKRQFFGLQQEYNNLGKHLNKSQQINQQLSKQINDLISQIGKQKKKSIQLSNISNDLKNRIETKSKQIDGFKNYLTEYERQWQLKTKRQNELNKKLSELQPIISKNSLLQESIYNLKTQIGQKDEQLINKQQYINDLCMQNKQISYKISQLQNNNQRNQLQIQQLQQKLKKQKQLFQKQNNKINNQYKKILEKQSQQKKLLINQKDQLNKDLEKIKLQGLIKQELKNQVKKLNQKCKKQQKEIQNMKGRFQNIKINLKNLKQKCSSFNQIEKTNTLLKNQLDASLTLHDQMINKIGGLYQQIENLTDQNWKLLDKLREDKMKDQFSILSSNKTISSNGSGASNSLRYSGVQSFQSKPFQSSILRTRAQASPQNYYSNSYGLSTERLNFNTQVNVSRTSKAKSIIGEDISKKILQPSSYYPSRETNYTSNSYTSVIGQLSSRQSGYGLQRRERR